MFKAAGEFLRGLPKEVWYGLAIVLLLLLGSCQVQRYGKGKYEAGRTDLLAEQAKAADVIEGKQEEVTREVVIEYVDRVKIVKEKGDVIVREVPVYVTVVDDSKCIINSGFVRLWNDANQGEVSRASAGADAAPSGVVLSEVATQKAIEAQICKANELQLAALQDWVRQQQALAEQ